MDPLIELQKQIKDNAEDVRRFVSDLSSWEEEMKRKESETRASQGSSKDDTVPPIRGATKKRDSTEDSSTNLSGESQSAKKRISASDYAAWEKFDVEKACEDIDKTSSNPSSLAEKEKQVNEERLRDQANVEKEKGNQFVKKEKWDSAIECYSRAIKCYPRDAIFYCNRALCFLKKKDFRAAETDCTSALALDGTYVKALHRRGLARKELNQLDEAFSDLLSASVLEPNNTAIRKDFAEIERTRVDFEMVVDFEQKKACPIVPAEKHRSSASSQREDISTKQTSASSVWPRLDDCVVIEPINIPPHKRSKKPLQRIVILESSDNADATSSKEPEPPIKAVSVSSVSLKEEVKQKAKISIPDDTKTCSSVKGSLPKCDAANANVISVIPSSSAPKVLPPVPKNSVQFIAGWRQINKDSKMCFQYLKQINCQLLPNIFQDSLDGIILSQILGVLATEFVSVNEPVLNYLQGLTKVKRFRTLTLFLSRADKNNMAVLLKHSQDLEKASNETLTHLKKEYEL